MREKKKIPGAIKIISIVTSLLGIYHIISGIMALWAGRTLSGYQIEDAFRILGLIWLLVGLYSIILSWGLKKMKVRSRKQGIGFLALLGILCFALSFTDMLLIAFGIVYLIFATQLGNPYIKKSFEIHDYGLMHTANVQNKSKFNAHRSNIGPSDHAPPHLETKPDPKPKRTVNVPENMVLCTNCEMLNKIDTVFCVRCAFDIEQLNILVREAFKYEEDEELTEPGLIDSVNSTR